MAIISRDNLDVATITETWFKNCNKCAIAISRYTLYRRDRVENGVVK